VAHHYLAVDRRWFDRHIKPGLTVIKISKQARAFIRTEIDEAAARLENINRDGRPSSEKGESAWAERERVASRQMPVATKSSTSRSAAKPSTPDLAQSAKIRREAWLAVRIERIEQERQGGTRPRVTFREAAARYLKDCIGKVDTADLIAFHIELLDPWIGSLSVDEVYDETLQPFKDDRLKPTVTKTGKPKQISLTTLNRSLEIVRRILNLCARSYRHPNRMTYLETAPLITIETNKRARKQYPLSWD